MKLWKVLARNSHVYTNRGKQDGTKMELFGKWIFTHTQNKQTNLLLIVSVGNFFFNYKIIAAFPEYQK